MKIRRDLAWCVVLAVVAFTSAYADAAPTLNVPGTSYAIGYNLGKDFQTHQTVMTVDLSRLMQGMKDGLSGQQPQLKEEEMAQMIQALQTKLMAQRQRQFLQQAKANKEQAEAFLAQNKKEPDVRTTKSGLQYKVITAGKGASPQKDDEVEVSYTGRKLDGTVFDSSDKIEGQVVRFNVSEVILGWTEVLRLMKSGAHYCVWLHPKLAYGETGAGGPIGPNELLIFDIKLNSFTSPSEAPSERDT